MSSEWRAVLAVIGAGMGAMLLVPTGHIVGALLGGIIVLGAVELNAIRTHVKLLDEEVQRLRQELNRNREPADAAAGVQTSRPVPQPLPPPAAQARSDRPAVASPWRKLESPPEHDMGRASERPRAEPSQPGPQQPRPVPQYVAAQAEFPPIRWVRAFLSGGNAVVRVGTSRHWRKLRCPFSGLCSRSSLAKPSRAVAMKFTRFCSSESVD